MERIDYNAWLGEAMQSLIKKAFKKIIDQKLQPNFFITFVTKREDVILSTNVKEKYPEQISIILQTKYKELRLLEDRFTVILSFNNKEQQISVPFNAISYFLDRDCNFAIELTPLQTEVANSSINSSGNNFNYNSGLEKEIKDPLNEELMEKKSKVIDFSKHLKAQLKNKI